MEKIFSRYLRIEKLPLSTVQFENAVCSHPNYPSLVSVTDVLDRFGISYNVVKMRVEQFQSLELPYILHKKRAGGGGEFVFVDAIHTRDSILKGNALNYVVFQLSGTFKSVQERDDEFLSKRYLSRLLFLTLTVLFVFTSVSTFNSFALEYFALLVTSLLGLALGSLIVSKELGLNLAVINLFCNNNDLKCDRVLNSKGSTLFGIKLSTAALTYFGFQLTFIFLGLTFVVYRELVITTLLLFGALAILLAGFSIYYQYLKAKAWCRLCVTLDILIIVQAPLLFHLSAGHWLVTTNLSVVSYSLFVCLTLICIAAVVIFGRQKLEQISKSTSDEIRHKRIVHSETVFTTFLSNGRRVENSKFDNEITIGNRDSPVKLIMAVNLYCNPCGEEYRRLVALMSTYPGRVNLSLRFVINRRNEAPTLHLFQYWLSSVFGKGSEEQKTRELFENWFNEMNFERFKKMYPLENRDVCIADQLVRHHQSWVQRSSIAQTPELFINGFQFPSEYRVRDLLTLIPILADHDSRLLKGKVTVLKVEKYLSILPEVSRL
jgi:uncharacterized membrane protein